MGDIKKKKNKFKKPRKLFDKTRIEEENLIVDKYGLKNKKEIWKAESEISKLRRRAKALIPGTDEERNAFFGKLSHMGLNVKTTADALALTKEDWLERRLQTQVYKRGITTTPSAARQLIVHKKIAIDGKIVNIPSFSVNSELEKKITFVAKGGSKDGKGE
jgi:small subunit ribosomal protein S4